MSSLVPVSTCSSPGTSNVNSPAKGASSTPLPPPKSGLQAEEASSQTGKSLGDPSAPALWHSTPTSKYSSTFASPPHSKDVFRQRFPRPDLADHQYVPLLGPVIPITADTRTAVHRFSMEIRWDDGTAKQKANIRPPDGQNAFLVKRKQSGGARFSKDPFNLVNKSSRKYDGFVSTSAISIQPAKSGSGVTLATKIPANVSKPAKSAQRTTLGAGKSSRATSKAVVKRTTQKGYRADLRQEAVARASQIKRSQRPVKDAPTPKLRGKKAKAKAAELN